MGWAATAAGVAFLLGVILLFNLLVRAKVRVREAWAQVAVQQQRRHDLIPVVLAAVNAYADHEGDLLRAVSIARNEALTATDPSSCGAAETQLSALMPRLIALGEAMPELQADSTFQRLDAELRDTEERLAFARDFANHRVASYRKLTDTLPGLLLARPFGFPREELFALEDEAAAVAPTPDLGGR